MELFHLFFLNFAIIFETNHFRLYKKEYFFDCLPTFIRESYTQCTDLKRGQQMSLTPL